MNALVVTLKEMIPPPEEWVDLDARANVIRDWITAQM